MRINPIILSTWLITMLTPTPYGEWAALFNGSKIDIIFFYVATCPTNLKFVQIRIPPRGVLHENLIVLFYFPFFKQQKKVNIASRFLQQMVEQHVMALGCYVTILLKPVIYKKPDIVVINTEKISTVLTSFQRIQTVCKLFKFIYQLIPMRF